MNREETKLTIALRRETQRRNQPRPRRMTTVLDRTPRYERAQLERSVLLDRCDDGSGEEK